MIAAAGQIALDGLGRPPVLRTSASLAVSGSSWRGSRFGRKSRSLIIAQAYCAASGLFAPICSSVRKIFPI